MPPLGYAEILAPHNEVREAEHPASRERQWKEDGCGGDELALLVPARQGPA